MLSAILASSELPLLEQGAVQFILFGLMVVVAFLTLWATISK